MDNLEETSLIVGSDSATCFVVGDALEGLDGNTLLFQPGQPVQLEDGTTAYISTSSLEDGSLQHIELENGATLVALNHVDSDSEITDQNCYLKVHAEPHLKKKPPSRRKTKIVKRQDVSISDGTDLVYPLGLEDDHGTTFSILHFEESNDAHDSGSQKPSLLDEDDLTRNSTQSTEDLLIDPDDPLPIEDVNEETCNNANDNDEFFKNHSSHRGNGNDDEDDDDVEEEEVDGEYEDDESSVPHAAVSKPIRRKLTQYTDGKSRTYACPFEGCSKVYTAVHHLKVHSRAHTGDRPFVCNQTSCDKRFATNYALKAHIRTHTGEKPYLCPEDSCSKGFKTSGDLQKHIRTHTGERPFKCNVPGCDRSFTTSNIRKVHVRTHTGERPYECSEPGCGRAFASATNFKNHMRIHSGEKPYVCTVKMCGRRFTEYSSLYKHQTVHTQQKPYECKDCGRNYRQSSTLTMHRRTTHGIIQTADGTEIMLQFPQVPSEKVEGYMFLELSEDSNTLVQLNSNQIECAESSTPSPALPVRADNDSEDDDVVISSSITMDDDDNSLKQIFVVSDDADIAAYDENFDALDSSVV